MAIERPPGAIGFTLPIKMQHYSSNLTPVRTLRVRIEQTQIGDDVFLVVNGQNGIGRCGIGDIWIKRQVRHGRCRKSPVQWPDA
jgi:hypothetical protein